MECIENDYMYLDLRKTYNLINIFIGIIIILCTAYIFNPYTAINLSKLVETVLMFTITFIATTVFKFSNKKIFILMNICLLFVALLKFKILMGLIIYFGERQMLQYINFKSLSICIILESIYCFLVIDHAKKVEIKTKLVIYLFALIAFIAAFLNYMYFFGITSIALFSMILYVLRDFKIYEKKMLNNLKLLILMNLIFTILNFFIYRFSLEILVLLNNILKIFLYFFIYAWISDMLIKKPYETLNKNIIDKNEKLEILNKRMEESNNEFKKFKKRIGHKEANFRKFFDDVPTSIVVLNKKNYRIFALNKRLVHELRLKNKRDIINRNLFKILNIHNKEELLLTKKGEASLIICGVEMFWDVYIILEGDDFLIISLKNISELKRSEKIKNNLKKRTLEEQIKNDFLSSISHDLKTPINVIYSSAQVQEQFYKEQNIEKVSYYNQVNKENCITLLRLANNLIDSSKINYDYLKPNFKVYNIVTLIEDLIGNLSEYIKEKNLTYIFDTTEEEIYVKCDQELIERIVLNLISNSIKHTIKGGIGVSITTNKNKVFIDFSDTGEGMDKEFLERAFLRYSKGKKKRKNIKNKSTGIGLYIVKKLVELQNGNIKINSIKDVGTNIRLEFNKEKECGI